MAYLITVALYHRDQFSRGDSRRIFGHEAYHWGFVITPPLEATSQGPSPSPSLDSSFDATDTAEIDPVTFRMNNPTMDWWLRAEERIDSEANPKLLGRVVVGKIPEEDGSMPDAAELRAFFGAVPLPVKNTHPQQSCVTWIMDAIRALQRRGWVEEFDIEQFKDWALRYADERLRGSGSKMIYYTP
ncbi:hypothetical protein GMORB2_5561 [Geosmithia morbida]|uniref:Uncharacterized protein n=1 Tax=Geosmithia morbida TaxID=1094350 RepID=A0A9P5D5J2_9HYPO|nr:uncharacterized protein GMORB2_5561 [Geosmithia morbida]KAF4123845.1 hypothetical protein GMORB2_5561 [Geosmithia morbida]